MKNKIELKKFFGTEVRVVNEDWIAITDFFEALDRLDSNEKVTTDDRNRLKRYLDVVAVQPLPHIMPVKSSKSRARNTIEVNCIPINHAPSIVLLFEPKTKSGDKYDLWCNFVRFVNDLLIANDVNVFDLTDKRNQISAQVKLDIDGGKVVVMNNMLSQMMAELCGVEGKILKGDIRTFQEEHPQIRLDLGLVYEEMREDFVNAFSFTQSHSNAKDMVLKKYKRKYDLNK